MEALSQFLSYMESHGLAPQSNKDIIPDNKRRNYRLATDKPGKKSGFYKLQIDGEFGFGFFGDYRHDEAISWHAKTDKKITDKDRAEYARRAVEQREAAEREQLALWQSKATEAQNFLLFLEDCPEDHPYLVKKGVKPYGLLLSGNDIVIPMSNRYGVWSYQTISPGGDKKFPYQARKSGTYFKIQGDETICVVEGYATGASVHEATGHTVIVAFDAGNLLPVAKEIRESNLDARIIICGDNDQYTKKPNGDVFNTGIEKGLNAAIEVNGLFIYPEFADITTKPTDWNDLHKIEGLQAVKDRIGKAQKPSPHSESPAVIASPQSVRSQHGGGEATDDWMARRVLNKKGEPSPASSTNLNLYMRHHDAVAGVFKYDSFSKRIIVFRCPPWENINEFSVRPISDYDYFRLECYLETEFGLKANKNKCADAIESTSQLFENTFNPASDYFNALVWDGVPRIDTWIQKYVSDGKQPDSYLRMVSRKFLCGMASRAINPGVKFDTMIILEGKQNAGKSYLSRILATINDVEYFLDDFKEIDNKDALMKIQGKLVIEFSEISTMRRAEVNDLKAFLSRTHDVYRPPYGRNTIEAPRQCVFVGTINPEGPYLRDVTDNRRYWPISCRDNIDINTLKGIIHLLHAEAAHYVKAGEQIWMSKDEYEMASIETEKRVLNDVWIDAIQDILILKNEITTDEILQALEIPKERRSPQMQSRINNNMTALGWEHTRLVRGSSRPRGFIRKLQNKQNDFLETEKEKEIPW
jgi:putative DNA primase/helicase